MQRLNIIKAELSVSRIGSFSLTTAGKKGESALTIFAQAKDSFASNQDNLLQSEEIFTLSAEF